MGQRGPVPKREGQRRRRNKPEVETETAAGAADVVAPPGDDGWHPIARAWYDALGRSGQAKFYEPADWATAYLLADVMSRELHPQPVVVGDEVRMLNLPPKAASVAAWRATMAALLVTEGDRRRVRLELERPPAAGAGGGAGGGGGGDVAWLDAARRSRSS